MFDKKNNNDKKYVTDKTLLKSIPDMIQKVGSKTEVFNQLKESLPTHQLGSLAKRIAAVATDDTKKQNRIPVYLLILLTLINFLQGILNYTANANHYTIVHLISVIIVSIIYILFLYGFARIKLFAFTTAVSLYTIGLVLSLYNLFFHPHSIQTLSFVGNIITLIFLHLLRKKIFPEITFWGSVKTDKEKKYIFST